MNICLVPQIITNVLSAVTGYNSSFLLTKNVTMRGIQKEMSQRPRNRNLYLYVRSIGPGCCGTGPNATQVGKWLSHKIPGAAL